ncbi:MAG: hypothetical protein KF830_02425 [Planctomycetes bacterium]|nr:hypothetical protein [Planctomycetota bacterium]
MRAHLLAASLAIASGTIAQSTLHVGPGGYAQITDALAAAADGDVILVAAGSYASFITNKAVTIRALVPGTVTSSGPFGNVLLNLPAGQAIHLVGLTLDSLAVFNARASLDLCTVPFGLSAIDADLHLQDCSISRQQHSTIPFLPGTALTATNSVVTAVGTTVRATPGDLGIATGMKLVGSRFHGSGVVLEGSDNAAGGPAVAADAASTLWLVDAMVSRAGNRCPIEASAGRLFRTRLTPACSPLPTGLVLGIDRSGPLAAGSPFGLAFRTAPFHLVAVFASRDAGRSSTPWLEQDLLLDLGGAWPAALLLAGPSGRAATTWQVPASTSLVDTTVWFQGISGYTLPLQASGLAGGVVR